MQKQVMRSCFAGSGSGSDSPTVVHSIVLMQRERTTSRNAVYGRSPAAVITCIVFITEPPASA
eukprot:COSAG03_NODE_2126_length_3097_cov_4.711474_2_plen_63_part_00